MLQKTRFVTYVNLLLFFLLVLLTVAPALVAGVFSFPEVGIMAALFFLVMLVWGVTNAFRYLTKPGLGNRNKLLLLVAPVNLLYLLVVLGVLSTMVG